MLISPFYEFSDYLSFIHSAGRYSKYHFSMRACLYAFGSGVLFLTSYKIIGKEFDKKYIATDDFLDQDLLYKNVHIFLSITAMRFKYYGIWYLIEGAFIMSGFAYAGTDTDGNQKFDNSIHVEGYRLEMTTDPKEMTSCWNSKTKEWLKFYIKDRMEGSHKSKKIKDYVATCMISVTLHGFLPSYCVSFLILAVIFVIHKKIKVFAPDIGFGFYNLLSKQTLSIAVVPFLIKDSYAGFRVYYSMKWQILGKV